MLGNRWHDVWAQRVLAAPSIATSSERRGVHRLKDVAKQLLNLLCKSTTLTAYSRAQCRRSLHRTGCEKAMLSTFSTECRTRLPCFWYFFKKVQKERVEEKYKWTIKVENCCRIWRRAKASFLPPNFCRWAPFRFHKKKRALALTKARLIKVAMTYSPTMLRVSEWNTKLAWVFCNERKQLRGIIICNARDVCNIMNYKDYPRKVG